MLYTIVSAQGFLLEDGNWGKWEDKRTFTYLQHAIKTAKHIAGDRLVAGFDPDENSDSGMIAEAADYFQICHLL